MTYEQMLAATEPCGVHVEETDGLQGNLTGVYDEELKTILIDQNMTNVQKRCTLVHELCHWAHGDKGCGIWSSKHAEVRAQQETALLLIDPVEYSREERDNDADAYRISCELDVTLFVVETYRNMLHSGLIPTMQRAS